jgi:hypothetical protein
MIERRSERPEYGLFASIVPETQCPEVYKERGKERIPYPLFELTATVDSILLYGSSAYIAGEVVKAPS